MQGAFADTLLDLERAHLHRLNWWAWASVLLGVLLMGALWRRRQGAALPFHLGVQSAAWGGVNLVIAWRAAAALSLRDHAGAVALDRFVWLNIGLDAGYALVGLTLIACGVWLGRRPGLIGAGIGVVVQGGALAILDFMLANQVGALL